MSKLILPTAGSANWGAALNAYLRSLDQRLDTFERRYGDTSDYEIVRNLGYASSGFSGTDTSIWYNSTQDKIYFYGTVFISGDVNIARTWKSDAPFVSDPISPSTSRVSNYYFVILSYDDNTDDFYVTTSVEFNCGYKDVLLGFFQKTGTTKRFVPYYYSSLKTIMQHYDELYNRWVNLDREENLIGVVVEHGQITSLQLVPTTYMMYAGGLLTATNQENASISKNHMAKVVPVEIARSSNVYYIKDESNAGVLSTTWCGTTAPEGDANKANIYRVLVTVFGDIIVQKAYVNDGTTIPTASYWSEQQLYNTRFSSNFLTDDGSSDKKPTMALDASLYVEVIRFGYQGDINQGNYANGNYVSLSNTTPANSINNITFAKSLTYGTATQQISPIWITQDSQLWLDNITFKANANSASSLHLRHVGGTGDAEDVYVVLDTTMFNGEQLSASNPPVLLSNVTDVGVDKTIMLAYDYPSHGSILTLNSFGSTLSSGLNYMQVTSSYITFVYDSSTALQISSTINANKDIVMAEETQITWTSDRRRKDNFMPVKEKYLDVVQAVPVQYYTYKNSDKQQVGIIAQDLEKAIPEHSGCFINVQNTSELLNQRSLYETKLTYILWKALQEEIAARKKLEQKLEALCK